MNKECFGLKNEHKMCSVLSGEGMIKLRKKYGEFCCTMKCPFYKPDKRDKRLGDKIVRCER